MIFGISCQKCTLGAYSPERRKYYITGSELSFNTIFASKEVHLQEKVLTTQIILFTIDNRLILSMIMVSSLGSIFENNVVKGRYHNGTSKSKSCQIES